MKKLIFLLALVAINHSIVFSQGCLPDGITFSMQQEIDNFQTNYPGCTEIEGSVTISDNWDGDITNLDGLIVLTSIGGALYIESNPNLIDITGLSNLNYIGYAWVFDGLSIRYNPSLTSLDGLEGITILYAGLDITQNDNLTSLSGLQNLNSIQGYGSIYISSNASLTNLAGLENLEYIDGNFYISDNNLMTDLTGLSDQLSINMDLNVSYMDTLASLAGIEGLFSIGGDLVINSNKDLGSLAGLANLSTIGGNISIENNDYLMSLSGLENIDANSITDLSVFDNDSLSSCNAYSICQYLASPNGTIEIHDNAPGCNSPDEVYDSCYSSPQPCFPEGIIFNTQQQIDIFQNNNPGCSVIEGNVEINGSGITNLNGLIGITAILGNLSIFENSNLSTFNGLNNLMTVGGILFIYDNPIINNLEGLNNLTAVGDHFIIGGNNELENLTGVENLISVGGVLSVQFNTALTSFSGLNNISEIYDLNIVFNPSITDLSGLENLTNLTGSLFIQNNNSLIGLDGLDNLSSIGVILDISNNQALINLNGLNSLTTTGALHVYDNTALNSFDGLNNLTSISGNFDVWGNTMLNDISALSNLTNIGALLIRNSEIVSLVSLENATFGESAWIEIGVNPNLSICDVQSICSFIENPTGDIIFYSNASGCNSLAEVQEHCLTPVEEKISNEEISLFPNPVSSFITFVAPQNQEIEEIIFYNQLGQVVLSVRDATNSINISNLTPGIYFAAVRTSDRKLMAKVFIE